MSGERAWMSAVQNANKLTDMQAQLVVHLSSGLTVAQASKLAGYATEQGGRMALQSHNVRIALDSAIRQRLANGTGAALSFLEAAFRGTIPGLPGGARVTAAIAWLDRAGYPVPRGEALGKDSSEKTLGEMSLSELRDEVRKLKAETIPDEASSLDDMLR